MNEERKILEVMARLGLEKTMNGLLTYAVLEEIWDTAQEEAYEQAGAQGIPHELDSV